MKTKLYRSTFSKHLDIILLTLLVLALIFCDLAVFAGSEPNRDSASAQEAPAAPRIPNNQIVLVDGADRSISGSTIDEQMKVETDTVALAKMFKNFPPSPGAR